MANEIRDAFATEFRDYIVDGVSSSGKHNPQKAGLRNLGVAIQSSVDSLKDQIDTVVLGIARKDAVDFATTANITLSGSQTVDGQASGTGKRALVKNQTNKAQNGAYITGAGAWARATDVDDGAEMLGATFFVKNGTAGGGKTFSCNTPGPITVGTTELTFVEIEDKGDMGLTKDDVGLDQVDNTSDAAKPISDATQLALNAKAPLASPPLTGNPTAPTQAAGDNSTKLATTAYADRAIVDQATEYQPGYDSDQEWPFVVVSEDGYILERMARQIEYDTDMAVGLAIVSIDGYFISKVDPATKVSTAAVINADAIRRSRQKLRMIQRGATEQCVVTILGDSYVDSTFPVWVRNRLVSLYGNAGPGWVTLPDTIVNGDCADTGVTVATAGTWTNSSSSKAVPGIATCSSSDTGTPGKKTITGTGEITVAWLHYIAAASAAARYRWNGGSWNALDLSTGYRIAMTTDAPASGGWTLEIEVTAGTIELAGIDLRNDDVGVIVNRLGLPGSTTNIWLAPTASTWQTAFSTLNSDIVFILLGTNDQAGAVSDEQIAINMNAIRHRVRAASPAADVVLMSPAENFLERARKMPDITAAVRTVAERVGIPHVDFQPIFGPVSSMADYRSDGVRPLMNVDDVHPDSFTGMVVLADTCERLLIQ